MPKKKIEKEEVDSESDELKNFPAEMGIADPEGFTDYANVKRDLKDSDTLRKIWHWSSRRLFPILSLTYLASVLGISLNHGTHFLFDKSAYIWAFVTMLWVALGPFLWIVTKSMEGFRGRPLTWYYWMAGSQVICGIIFLILFPEGLSGIFEPIQLLFAAALPMHVVIYFLFIKRMLPAAAMFPLSIIGGITMIYGLVVL